MTDFAALFDEFKARAFRFEGLPAYDVAEESLAFEAFRKGEPVPTGWHDDWIAFLRECKRHGKSICRVRLIPDPPTQYFQFETLHGYSRSRQAGEEINGLRLTDLPSEFLRPNDFWLFDGFAVGKLQYGRGGTFEGVEVSEDPVEVERFGKIAATLLSFAKPME